MDAKKKWDALIKNGVDPENVIESSKKYAAEQKGKEVQFIKLPATFLGPGKHYEEYYSTAEPESKESAPSHNWNKMTKEEQDNWVS